MPKYKYYFQNGTQTHCFKRSAISTLQIMSLLPKEYNVLVFKTLGL